MQSMDDFKVGEGASTGFNGDSYPFTVIEKKGKRIVIQADNYHCTKAPSSYGAEDGEYEFTRNPNGHTETWSLRKNGYFRRVGADANSGWFVSPGRCYRRNPSF